MLMLFVTFFLSLCNLFLFINCYQRTTKTEFICHKSNQNAVMALSGAFCEPDLPVKTNLFPSVMLRGKLHNTEF